ncbi:membrane fusion protein, multidrug efflux system [Marinospirillum celere]|uniref:Membrane fusion protein, multidrug efflux system n=1 Tax=Marinospirillum celere TaxID=1122252 RepID=A0A1I1JJM0_9GAMM|nr:efflux RND transporter periplasmic adaptor subunit [Marinospirillum celere]SFC48754.1 membrane fusion protein, multidrug efflux system [Marinospirillum celere]
MSFATLSRNSLKLSALFLPLAFLIGCSTDESASEQAAEAQQQRPPAPVTIAPIEVRDVNVTVDYAGRVRGSRQIEVRARVGGILEERLYVEGQQVEEGAPLFQLDPEPYQIALQLAEANERNARANLDQARRELRRVADLYERNSISQRERDQALTAVELAESSLAQTQAAVADARRNLRYTRVTAPISGITGMETLSEGSLLNSGSLLTSITQKDPAHVRFSLPENDAAVQRLARQARSETNNGHLYSVFLQLPDGSEFEHEGKVNFTDSSIDARTGSVSARAVFPNPEGVLIPGQFVRVSLVLQTFEDAVVIPQTAVIEGSQGTQVFVLAEDNKAEARAVELGPVTNGKQVILSGLQAGEQLIINGQVALHDGAAVQVTNAPDEEE